VDELVDVLCGWEATTESIVDAKRATQLRIELVHRHLPVLSAAGLVSYDRAADEVAIEPLSHPVKQLVRRSIDAE
jgi:ribosome biogenesis protein Tsr3